MIKYVDNRFVISVIVNKIRKAILMSFYETSIYYTTIPLYFYQLYLLHILVIDSFNCQVFKSRTDFGCSTLTKILKLLS